MRYVMQWTGDDIGRTLERWSRTGQNTGNLGFQVTANLNGYTVYQIMSDTLASIESLSTELGASECSAIHMAHTYIDVVNNLKNLELAVKYRLITGYGSHGKMRVFAIDSWDMAMYASCAQYLDQIDYPVWGTGTQTWLQVGTGIPNIEDIKEVLTQCEEQGHISALLNRGGHPYVVCSDQSALHISAVLQDKGIVVKVARDYYDEVSLDLYSGYSIDVGQQYKTGTIDLQ